MLLQWKKTQAFFESRCWQIAEDHGIDLIKELTTPNFHTSSVCSSVSFDTSVLRDTLKFRKIFFSRIRLNTLVPILSVKYILIYFFFTKRCSVYANIIFVRVACVCVRLCVFGWTCSCTTYYMLNHAKMFFKLVTPATRPNQFYNPESPKISTSAATIKTRDF